ncbi:MAG TPA: hypothetical protein VJX67_17020 [Blastocatellia bacterium]|nr:hypothetical protein [Blastocatellia bacterium]
MEAYTFAIKTKVRDNENQFREFKNEVDIFVRDHKHAVIQSCAMTSVMYPIVNAVIPDPAGMIFGVIFYEAKK